MAWELHFRNFSQGKQYFGVYHAGCGGAPWHTNRPRCWETLVDNNPTGGDNSVYVPNSWVVNFAQWFKVVEDVSEILGNLALYIGSEGEDEDSLEDALSDATSLSQDIIAAKLAASKYSTAELTALAAQNFASTCQQIGQSQQQVVSYMEQMGFGSNGWGLIAGDAYQSKIYNDSDIVDGFGWTILTCPDGDKHWNNIANHAFVQEGHLIYMFDPNNINGFWNPFS